MPTGIGISNTCARKVQKSLTNDQVLKMAAHRRLTTATGMTVYFANPHSP